MLIFTIFSFYFRMIIQFLVSKLFFIYFIKLYILIGWSFLNGFSPLFTNHIKRFLKQIISILFLDIFVSLFCLYFNELISWLRTCVYFLKNKQNVIILHTSSNIWLETNLSDLSPLQDMWANIKCQCLYTSPTSCN